MAGPIQAGPLTRLKILKVRNEPMITYSHQETVVISLVTGSQPAATLANRVRACGSDLVGLADQPPGQGDGNHHDHGFPNKGC